MAGKKKRSKSQKEARLRAELEEVWQEESPTTARRTEFADEVDGELGTRERAVDEDEHQPLG